MSLDAARKSACATGAFEDDKKESDMAVSVFFKETKYEFMKLMRVPRFSLMTIAFPLLFYIIYGILLYRSQHIGGLSVPSYMLATFGTFGVIGVCLFGIGVNLANERALGWLELKQASPLMPGIYSLAKLTMCVLFSVVEVGALFALGIAFADVRMSVESAIRLIAILVAGAIPFGALGLALGYFAKPNSAPAFVNLIYLPMAILSGLWIPLEFLPKALQSFAIYMPPYHLSRLALGVFGADGSHAWWGHWEALAGFTLLFLGLAKLGYRRDESRKNGAI
jgi:ABC-2 type transport system permease protein